MNRTEPTTGLIEVKNLTISTKTRTLVHNFNLSMRPGDRVGLIGESGSGKSMTASALMGLLPEGVSAQGSINFAGATGNLVDAKDSQWRKIRGQDMTMVFQEPLTALNPLMKVGPQISEIMTQHQRVASKKVARTRVVELLQSMELADPQRIANSYPHQLSGGQRQRALLAMALANNPSLLLCDEPTTALDVTVQRQILELIKESVSQRGTGLLFITHDLSVVANICDRVLVMNDGSIVEEGRTEEVFSNPQHPYTRGLLAASDLNATDAQGRLFTVASAASYVPPQTKEPAIPALAEPVPVSEALEPSKAIISVTELYRSYPAGRTSLFGKTTEVPALAGVNFEVAAGQRFGIVGESGSGKSTLLRILAGLDQPTSGSVNVAGTQITGAKEHDLRELRQQLQIIFQDPLSSLDPRMRVRDIVAEPLLAPGQKIDSAAQRRLVTQMLSSVGLPADAAERFPHQFSGGQRQRISIARALICQPKILVADEPVSALDVSVRAQVLNLLSDLVDDYQLTLVFVSHDLAVVRHLCDHVAVLNSGRIVESGSTEQIYDNPQHPYTRALVNSSMSLRHELSQR